MIYFIESGEGGPIKVGYARIPTLMRLDQLQCGNPVTLRLLAVTEGEMQTEQDLHAALFQHRVRGEWFKPVDLVLELVEFAKDGRSGLEMLAHVRALAEGKRAVVRALTIVGLIRSYRARRNNLIAGSSFWRYSCEQLPSIREEWSQLPPHVKGIVGRHLGRKRACVGRAVAA